MRKYLSVLLALALLASCALPAGERSMSSAQSVPTEAESLAVEDLPNPAITTGLVAGALLDSQDDGESYTIPEDTLFWLTEAYGLEPGTWSEAAVYVLGGVNAGEIAVIQPGAEGGRETIAQALEEYRQNRLADFTGYAPEQAAVVEKGRVAESGGWVALLLCEDVTAAQAAFEEAAGAAVPPEDSEPRPSPTLEPR